MSQQTTAQYEQNGHQQYAHGQAFQKLISNLRGELILPGDAAYEAERKVWNGSFDYYPAAIMRCVDVEDIKAAVNVAREQAMTLSVRSGGHSLPGHGTNEGGLVIDLSGMKTITVDPIRRTAHLEPGLTWQG